MRTERIMYASKDRRQTRTAKHQQHRIDRGCINRQESRQAQREMRWAK